MSVVCDICLFRIGPVYDRLLGGVLFQGDVLWVVWCCDFVEVCADHGGVNVFHVCLNFGVVYGGGVCVNVCGVVCVVVSSLFLTSGCCMVCCDACSWRCSFMGSVDVVCVCLLCIQFLFWVRCFVLSVVFICLCLMQLLVTIWWKRTRVWVLLWLCMLRGSFLLSMLLMWVLWVSVLLCMLLLLWNICVCGMWVWGRESVLVFLGWCSWGVCCCLFVVQVVWCILLGLVRRDCMSFCLGWEWGCLSESMCIFHVGMIECLRLLC